MEIIRNITIEEIQKWQAEGAEKSPEELYREWLAGKAMFARDDAGALVRAVFSIPYFAFQFNEKGEISSFWREYKYYLWEEEVGRWVSRERKYPLPAIAWEQDIPMEKSLRDGIRRELGAKVAHVAKMGEALATRKDSLTAGLSTIYTFFPHEVTLASLPCSKLPEALVSGSILIPPEGEIWRMDGKKVRCFHQAPYRKNWDEELMRI